MKKYILPIVAALLGACTIEKENEIIEGPEVTFTASFESDNSTRTVVQDNGVKVLWEASEEIGIYYNGRGGRFVSKNTEPATAAEFSGPSDTIMGFNEGSAGENPIWGLYPYREDASSDKESVTTVLPACQTGRSGSFARNTQIFLARSSGMNLQFFNITGGVRFSLTKEGVKKVTFESNGGENLAGTIKIAFSDSRPAVQKLTGGTTKLILVAPDGGSFQTGQWYYIVSVPAVLSKGFKMCFYTDSDVAELTSDSSNSIKRGTFASLAKVDAGLTFKPNPTPPDNEIWYKTSTGRAINASNTDFGANLISNSYTGGKGIMKFDEPVTKVPDYAFSNFMDSESAHLMEIALPESVTSIGDGAFYQTEDLQSILIPDSVRHIGHQAFMYTSLEELHLPANVEIDGNISVCNSKMRAFYSNYASEDHRCLIIDGKLASFAPAGLTEYTVPDGVTFIGDQCFLENKNLQRIDLPSSLRTIGASAFERTGIHNLVIPEGVETIDYWAFRANENLETISFPNSLQTVGSNIVGECNNLVRFEGKFASADGKCLVVDGELLSFARKDVTTYTIPSGVVTIGADVFWNDDYLVDVTVSEGVREIKRGAFYACDNLKSIYFPETLETLGSRALSSSNLETIRGPHASSDGKCFIFKKKLICVGINEKGSYTLPDGIEEIGAEAFLCSWWLTELTIPEGVRIIDENAFRICQELTTIFIPSTVISIGNHDDSQNELFYGCPSLKRVFCKATTPPQLKCTLLGNAMIYVHNDALDAYNSDQVWNQYSVSGIDSFEPPTNMYESSDYSLDKNPVCLQKASEGYGIDVMLIGDGYSDRMIADGTYEQVMRDAYKHLFSKEPYKSLKEYFNVYFVYAVSKNEVFSPFSDTALGCYFGKGTFISGNLNRIISGYACACPYVSYENILAVVLLNSDMYSGTCHMYDDWNERDYGCGQAIAFVPKDPDDDTFRDVLLHEAFGHGFAKLDDEYDNGAPITETDIYLKYESPYRKGWYKNIDITSDPAKIKWSRFISDERYASEAIGVYEGGGTFSKGAYRPTENSMMRYNTGEFNAPSREAIWYRIHKLAYGEEWQYDYEDFVAFDLAHRAPAAAARNNTAAHRNMVEKVRPPLAPPVVHRQR